MLLTSIIVPVYQVEPYLQRCIDSILALDLTDFELILVDDHSPDNCGMICDVYAQKDSRIRVIHKAKNEGLAAARNSGLEIASGKYVLFCDSDDAYDVEKLREILERLGEYPDSWKCFNYRNVWAGDVEDMLPYPQADVKLDMLEKNMDFLSCIESHKTMGYAVWDKVYSKEIIDRYHIRVLERDMMGNKDDWAEDLSFNLQYGMCVNHIHVDETAAYLLSKHGTPEQQTEDCLIGRIDHMLNIMLHLQNTPAYMQNETCQRDFWKIAIWHIKRYLYLEAGAKGMQGLRESCLQSANWMKMEGWIRTALKQWRQYGQRWNERESRDYQYMLQYLISGNLFVYKVRSYLLWKVCMNPGKK